MAEIALTVIVSVLVGTWIGVVLRKLFGRDDDNWPGGAVA